MTLQEAQHKLGLARKRQRKTRVEIDELRAFIIRNGGDPDNRINQTPRNALIYKLWKEGKSFVDIGRYVNLSSSRVSSLCKRIDMTLERKRGNYREYEKLLKKSTAQLAKINAGGLTTIPRTSEG